MANSGSGSNAKGASRRGTTLSARLRLAATALLLLGGCGDGSLVISFGTRPPQVIATTPKNGAVTVDPTTGVSAVFDQAMDASTISAGTFTLRTASAGIDGFVSYDSTTRSARFTPNQPLPLLTTCTATLSSTIRSADGHNLREDYIWSFTTRDGSLAAAAAVFPSAAPPIPAADTAAIASADGGFLEAWIEPGGDGLPALFAQRYFPASEHWSSPDDPLSAAGERVAAVVAAGDAAGNALIAWRTTDPARVYVCRYQAAADRWLAPVLAVAGESGDISGLELTAGSGGRFTLEWHTRAESGTLVRQLRFE